MPDIAQLLESALADEPGYTVIDAAALVSRARRGTRRRRAATVASATVVGAAVTTMSLLVPGGAPSDHRSASPQRPVARMLSVAQIRRLAAAQVRAGSTSAVPRGYSVHGITAASLPGLVERYAHVRLSEVSVDVLPTVGDVDLAAGIGSAQGQYFDVQVTPPGTTSTTPPTCADISGNGPDGDGYTGACMIMPLGGGGYVVVRSGRTTDGKGAKTEADLVASDGSGIFAECVNQLAESIDSLVRLAPSGFPSAGTSRKTTVYGVGPGGEIEKVVPPTVSAEPPLTSAQLESLVRTLAAQR